jgi:hypothetical protein
VHCNGCCWHLLCIQGFPISNPHSASPWHLDRPTRFFSAVCKPDLAFINFYILVFIFICLSHCVIPVFNQQSHSVPLYGQGSERHLCLQNTYRREGYLLTWQ